MSLKKYQYYKSRLLKIHFNENVIYSTISMLNEGIDATSTVDYLVYLLILSACIPWCSFDTVGMFMRERERELMGDTDRRRQSVQARGEWPWQWESRRAACRKPQPGHTYWWWSTSEWPCSSGCVDNLREGETGVRSHIKTQGRCRENTCKLWLN